MPTNDDIQSGLWSIFYDYDRNVLRGPQILVTGRTSRHMITWLAILLTLTLPCLYIWLRRMVLAIIHATLRETPPDGEEDREPGVRKTLAMYLSLPGDEENPLKSIKKIGEKAGRPPSRHGPIALPDEDGHNGELANEEPPPTSDIWPNFREDLNTTGRAFLSGVPGYRKKRETLALWLSILFFMVLFVGGIYATVRYSDIADDSVVCTSSQKAGAWKSNPDSPDFLLGDRFVIDEDRQRRVWAYKDACYNGDQSDLSCETFYRTLIPSTSEVNISCPFDGDICLYGKFGAYRRTTGLLDSNILGINAPASKIFHFRKTMDCSPLRMDSPYITPGGPPVFPNQYLYDYGPQLIGDFTDPNTYRNPMEWKPDFDDITPYTLWPVVYVPGAPARSNFYPLREVTAGNKVVTLFFISTAGEYFHVLESHDPIFPAHKSIPYRFQPDKRSLFWYNNSTRAGVLGCVDSHEICPDSTGKGCWGPFDIQRAFDEKFQDDLARRRAFYLLIVALEDFYAWKVVQYPQASVLDATRRARRFVGIRLHPEQWKIEVDGIFNATLAAMQIRIFDYARGTYRSHENVIDSTPSSLKGASNLNAGIEISKMFKFRNSAYQNVSAIGFWAIIAVCIILFVGSRRFSTSERRKELIERTNEGGYHDQLWAWILWKACIVVEFRELGMCVFNTIIWLAVKIMIACSFVKRRWNSYANLSDETSSSIDHLGDDISGHPQSNGDAGDGAHDDF
ncbi:hypothetical protein BT63DRAFT_419745 [Microthyrium microscopicum]|uniref:Uncharacterized protein n=1 Tax=Microthyrium microscopicum TaxID=703497 RepID=A0A6A6USK1_9PEZI|nr:hypothetical protein BT63DRAFT_419745 [Microthyrium microscopicum]